MPASGIENLSNFVEVDFQEARHHECHKSRKLDEDTNFEGLETAYPSV